jgi:DNA polymerase-3 subunit epsilon
MILVFDTETTGLTLHPKAPAEMQPRIVEFGGIFLNPETGEVAGEVQSLINPEMPIPAETTKIHGITDAMVQDAPTFAQFMPDLFETLKRAKVIVAHNLPFDRHILNYECRRCGEALLYWPLLEFDSIDLYRQAWGKEMKLSALYEDICGRKMEAAHRVMPDVRALVEIIQTDALYELLR